MGEPPNQAYVSYYLYGSPGHFYGIKACRFVTEVNSHAITDLDSFLVPYQASRTARPCASKRRISKARSSP